MTNPLLQKYEELYGKKEEPKPDYYKGEKSYAEELKKVEYELDPEFVKQLKNKSTLPTDPTTKKLSTLASYDVDSGKDSFLQIAEKVKNKKAQVVSMSMEMGHPIGKCLIPKTLTFEVIVYEDTP